MKKIIIGSLIGALIIFLWQFISFGAANLHEPAQAYTEKQTAILDFLAAQDLKEGGYIMPSLPRTASSDEWQAMMDKNSGQPWASIQYHNKLKTNMAGNMIRGFLVNVLIVFLFCWITGKMANMSMRNIVLAALAVGLIVFMNAPYTNHIWYEGFDTTIHLLDAVVSWGLVGLWLGWLMSRGQNVRRKTNYQTSKQEVTA
ncbi:MAG: hypothetical protein H0U44_07880 [Flavisolibacter sp.]|jgi:hypothetical protein|nr:hypothetical protein [Flavisolibacter sp.]